MKISDLLVLIEHESTKESEASDSFDGAGRITTAKVLAQLKGEFNGDKITIHHFYYGNTPNAPNPVIFSPEAASPCILEIATPTLRKTISIKPTRQYLAFLKKQEDGSYIPATPQYDSNLSFVPLGGDINELWTSPAITGRGEPRPGIRTFVLEKTANVKVDQDGADQPATAPDSGSKGKEESHPESKPAPR